jgi:hypothetical protein
MHQYYSLYVELVLKYFNLESATWLHARESWYMLAITT